jgi:hypothetical protein
MVCRRDGAGAGFGAGLGVGAGVSAGTGRGAGLDVDAIFGVEEVFAAGLVVVFGFEAVAVRLEA